MMIAKVRLRLCPTGLGRATPRPYLVFERGADPLHS
jgi:hypothetical protein